METDSSAYCTGREKGEKERKFFGSRLLEDAVAKKGGKRSHITGLSFELDYFPSSPCCIWNGLAGSRASVSKKPIARVCCLDGFHYVRMYVWKQTVLL